MLPSLRSRLAAEHGSRSSSGFVLDARQHLERSALRCTFQTSQTAAKEVGRVKPEAMAATRKRMAAEKSGEKKEKCEQLHNEVQVSYFCHSLEALGSSNLALISHSAWVNHKIVLSKYRSETTNKRSRLGTINENEGIHIVLNCVFHKYDFSLQVKNEKKSKNVKQYENVSRKGKSFFQKKKMRLSFVKSRKRSLKCSCEQTRTS